MSEYKRVTMSGYRIPENKEEVHANFRLLYNRLAELEDKIEQGTLIEMPRLLTYVDYCYGLEKYVVQWQVNGQIKSKTFWNEKKALKKLKELKTEENDLLRL